MDACKQVREVNNLFGSTKECLNELEARSRPYVGQLVAAAARVCLNHLERLRRAQLAS